METGKGPAITKVSKTEPKEDAVTRNTCSHTRSGIDPCRPGDKPKTGYSVPGGLLFNSSHSRQ